jgi:hypothetical protein
MGGTGLEPVTPSLSRRHPPSRPLARACSFSFLCRNFPLDARTAFAFVCAPSSVLVVARGSTVCSCGHPAHARTECDIRARASTQYSHGGSGVRAVAQPGLVSSESRRQYGIALYDADGDVIEGAQYVHASDEPPTPGLRIDLPQGTWFVHEVATELFCTVVTRRP